MIKELKILKNISFTDSKRLIRDLYLKDKINLVSMEYVIDFDNKFRSKDLKNIDTWMTYEDCIDVKVNYKGEIEVILWEGDNLTGHRTRKKWKAVFKAKLSNLSSIKDIVHQRFNWHCMDLFEIEEELRKRNRIEDIKKELLEI